MTRMKKILVIFVIAVMVLGQLAPTAPVAHAAKAKKAVTISSISNIKKTVKLNETFSMPTKVTAIMSDKTKKQVAVKWDKKLTAAKAGTFKAQGTITGFKKKITYTLIVKKPTMGKIVIEDVTDVTLLKPTEVKLVNKDLEDYNSGKKYKSSMVSVTWEHNAKEATQYKIITYDEYDQVVERTNYSVGNPEDMKKMETINYDINLTNNVTIRTITISPLRREDNIEYIGETAVFECSIKVNPKVGKEVQLRFTPSEWDANRLEGVFSKTFSPYTSYKVETTYKNYDYKRSSQGSTTDKDGKIANMYVNKNEYDEKFADKSAINTLYIYSDAKVTGDNKATYTVTKYPVKIVLK